MKKLHESFVCVLSLLLTLSVSLFALASCSPLASDDCAEQKIRPSAVSDSAAQKNAAHVSVSVIRADALLRAQNESRTILPDPTTEADVTSIDFCVTDSSGAEQCIKTWYARYSGFDAVDDLRENPTLDLEPGTYSFSLYLYRFDVLYQEGFRTNVTIVDGDNTLSFITSFVTTGTASFDVKLYWPGDTIGYGNISLRTVESNGADLFSGYSSERFPAQDKETGTSWVGYWAYDVPCGTYFIRFELYTADDDLMNVYEDIIVLLPTTTVRRELTLQHVNTYKPILYVSEAGDDLKSGHTAEKSVASMSRALELIKAYACEDGKDDWEIVVSGRVVGTATLNGELNIKSLTIRGSSAATDILDGNFDTYNPIASVDSGAPPVTFQNIKIMNGKATGGAIYIGYSAKATLSDGTVVTNNHASASGGAIYVASTGSLTIHNAIISENSAGGDGKGGAIYAGAGSTILIDGSSYIPAGADGKNDIFLFNTAITLSGIVSPPAECTDGIVAVITPNTYSEDKAVLDGSSVGSCYQHFAVTKENAGNADEKTWIIDSAGTLHMAYSVGTISMSVPTYSGSGFLSLSAAYSATSPQGVPAYRFNSDAGYDKYTWSVGTNEGVLTETTTENTCYVPASKFSTGNYTVILVASKEDTVQASATASFFVQQGD